MSQGLFLGLKPCYLIHKVKTLLSSLTMVVGLHTRLGMLEAGREEDGGGKESSGKSLHIPC